MFLKKSKYKSGRTYLSIVDSYYDKNKGYSRTKTIEKIGYLDEFINKFEDPIAHFSQIVEQMKIDKKESNTPINLEFSPSQKLTVGTNKRKNFGYSVLSSIYHELEIDKFLINRQRSTKIESSTNDMMKLLVYSRLLNPASKKKTYENKDMYFEKNNFTLNDLYRSLTFLNKKSNELQLWINNRIKEKYNRDTSVVYYDVTNYYFEIDKQDELRRKGVSKEHRPNPIVQMGLFMDTNGIPIAFDLYPGNTNDCLTYRPTLSRIKKEYELGKTIVVADKGMTTGDNIYYTLSAKDGYVFSMSVRGGNKELKKFVLDQNGYEWLSSEYKRKDRLYPREIKVTGTSGKKLSKTVHEKQVVFYSEKYAKKARADRATAIEKAMKLVQSPSGYSRATSYGAAGYVKNLEFDKKTGEILNPGNTLYLDEEKIKQEEALDGYYVIITSEYKESSDSIIEMYRGLWRIEESFRVTKSDLESRPVYVSREDHIKAHFLTCFVALVIARILELKLGRKHSIGTIIESLQKCSCTNIQQNYYFFDYFDEVLRDIEIATNVDLSTEVRTLKEIKKNLANTKI
ncbi:MAG: IS1634 family transposase [Peptostreptococcaceae bacterium]|nr:IS1634 family transposase [Peptostreptococcaceae bacterium]